MKIGKFSISEIRYVSNLFVFGQTSLLIKMKVIRALFRMALAEKWLLLNFGGMKLLTKGGNGPKCILNAHLPPAREAREKKWGF